MDFREIQEPTEDLIEMRASKPVLGNEEDNVENTVTENKLPEGFKLFKTAFDFFYDMDDCLV